MTEDQLVWVFVYREPRPNKEDAMEVEVYADEEKFQQAMLDLLKDQNLPLSKEARKVLFMTYNSEDSTFDHYWNLLQMGLREEKVFIHHGVRKVHW